MTNLTDSIAAHGGILTAWDDPKANGALSSFSISGSWIEFPAPRPFQGNGRYFGYEENGAIGSFLSVSIWQIECRDPLKYYLWTVDEFDHGRLGQGRHVWTHWNEDAITNTAVAECPIGSSGDNLIARIEYQWSRNYYSPVDTLQIVTSLGPRIIVDSVESSTNTELGL